LEEKDKKFEDFADFDEANMELPELEQDLAQEDENYQSEINKQIEEQETFEEEENIQEPQIEEDETQSLELEPQDDLAATPEEFEEENKEQTEQTQEEPTQWEEMNDDNSVVKKYIVYVSKDFVPYIDNLNTDERSAYINDAIQRKIDAEDIEKQEENKKRIKTHFIIAILTFCIMTPLALLGVNKAIMLTFENYKYSQDNFEKLYKQRFEKDRVYMRSVQYNKELEKRKKH